ncbi:FAD-dependent oxidoreductase [Catalinimonas niigatensis]|uniref:FAD-dependent oxidoreductase n=1 Tax=Catalinimonas niigatensis TaxID=1397264 RepID=UPI002665C462|nr:FAD-dependent oxidoreductase [Catalinimonas niigatensis]WPP50427.1 FAD-dependent oxidoreductase [Catalinimonas niigatensis]
MKKLLLLGLAFFTLACSSTDSIQENNQSSEYDIVIYGATSGGIAAAIQASRMDKSVLLIEPYQRIGGMTTGGLGQTDIGNKSAIGGISREFYQNIRKYYEDSANWEWQDRQEYQDGGQTRTEEGEDAMWTFEPSAALDVYEEMIAAENIELVIGKKLNREEGVTKDGTSITQIEMEDGTTYRGKMFIDATYEGDLMAAAGVNYFVGREANSMYGETYNGVQLLEGHQFPDGIDPYVTPGDPESGLVWGISEAELAEQGSGDDLVQAYNFRICLTNDEENRIPITEPENYDASRYELLPRLIDAQPNVSSALQYFIWSKMPNDKTDINNRGGFSTDMINWSHDYPEASYEERDSIIRAHVDYTKGLLYFFATDSRIPASFREEISQWGYPKDEYEENGNWSPQLYVREARRLIGAYVMTQANCVGEEEINDPVGLAAYTMDSHNCQRIVVESMRGVPAGNRAQVKNEGNVEVGGFPPYPISYRAIIPKPEEATNLLVPVCLSASHIAFGSIRMEPVFMVLGQSAATAAAMAIDNQQPVQELDYSALRSKLEEDQQRLVHQN